MIFNVLFIQLYLFEKQSYGEGSSNYLPTAGSARSQHLHSGLSHGWQEPKRWAIVYCFLVASVGSWMGSKGQRCQEDWHVQQKLDLMRHRTGLAANVSFNSVIQELLEVLLHIMTKSHMETVSRQCPAHDCQELLSRIFFSYLIKMRCWGEGYKVGKKKPF